MDRSRGDFMPRALLVCIFASVMAVSGHLSAQSTSPPAKPQVVASKTTPNQKAPPPKPKLTPDQVRGLRMLKAAQAEAAALDPDMRAAVLWQIARGMKKVDQPQSIRITKNAFQASLEIPNPSAEVRVADRMGSKAWLQMQILEELIESSPSDAEALLPQAEQWARDVLSVRLISGFVKDKKLDHAEDLIRRMSEHDFFPYEAAAELMLAQKSQDRSR